jgi:mRNA interferase RelE/StbE
MKYRVEITKPAFKHLKAIKDLQVRKKLLDRIEQLEVDPEQQGKALKDDLSGLRSVRAVNQRYRIVFQVLDERVTVFVVAVGMRRQGDRSDIYRIASQLMQSGFMPDL